MNLRPVGGGGGAGLLVEAAGFELALHDPQVARELGVVLPYFVEEPLCVLATNEYLDRITQRMIEAASLVEDDVDDHRGADVTAASFVA